MRVGHDDDFHVCFVQSSICCQHIEQTAQSKHLSLTCKYDACSLCQPSAVRICPKIADQENVKESGPRVRLRLERRLK